WGALSRFCAGAVTFSRAGAYDAVPKVGGARSLRVSLGFESCQESGGAVMRVIIWKSPRFLSGILRAVFKVK
ncbi:MAG: hypothetical protein RRZ93_04670, partial [Ruthenibacterium sp.]